MTAPFITYRGQVPISTNTTTVAKNIPLTVQEMDKNLYTLAYEIDLRAPIHNAVFTGTTAIALAAISDGTIESTDIGINQPASGRFTALIAEDNLTFKGQTTAATQYFKVTDGSTDKLVVDSANGNTSMAGTLSVTGATALSNTLSVIGDTTIAADLAVNGGDITTTVTSGTFNLLNSGLTGSLNIGGDATTVNVGANTGTITLRNPTVVGVQTTQNLYDAVATTVNAFGAGTAINVGANTGTITLRNPTVVGGQTTQNLWNTVATTVNAFGAGTAITIGALTGTTTIRNNAIVGGTLTATGATSLGGTLVVTGTTSFNGNTGITGSSTFTVGTGATALGGTLAVTGNTALSGALTVTGAATLQNNATVGGTLSVTGATTLSGTLGITGATTATSITASTSVSSPVYTSTVATGTAPMTVASTTRVANLNVASAGTADQFLTARNINGVSFNGTANINVPNLQGQSGTITVETTDVASAVNRLSVTNSATSSPVIISASGSDANIGLNIQSKGSQDINISSGPGVAAINLKPGSGNVKFYDDDSSNYYQLVTGNRTANYNITLPAGDVVLTAGTTVVTDATNQSIGGIKTYTGTLSVSGTLSVASSAKVTNLNSDKVDGFDIADVNTSGTAGTDSKYGLAMAPATTNGTITWVAPGTNGSILESTGVGGIPRWISPSALQAGNAALSANISAGATGDLLYQSASNTTAKLPIGSNGAILTSNGSTPVWSNSIASLIVSGTVTHAGLTMTAGTDVDQIYAVTDSAQIIGTAWQNTSINAAELQTGTYMVQVTTGTEVYSGIMSWYASNINSGVTDEIVLHKASTGSESSSLFLRVERTDDGSSPDMTLQISSSASRTSAAYTYKFRRMI